MCHLVGVLWLGLARARRQAGRGVPAGRVWAAGKAGRGAARPKDHVIGMEGLFGSMGDVREQILPVGSVLRGGGWKLGRRGGGGGGAVVKRMGAGRMLREAMGDNYET
ncbi:hypothetical protein E2C01_027126 [Portunus trituberculatus]|uniref:Uncharacterized protein n=1 Tax=Portunus trituberculatus TaxID=210409 RepID=A0A5B7EMY1_PORTR|nr:hypothetical protein [Portunus trituberculatus]